MTGRCPIPGAWTYIVAKRVDAYISVKRIWLVITSQISLGTRCLPALPVLIPYQLGEVFTLLL